MVKRKIPSPCRKSTPRTPIIHPGSQRYTDWAIAVLNNIHFVPETLILLWKWFPLISLNEKLRKNCLSLTSYLELCTKFWSEKAKGRGQLEDVGVGRKIILEWILQIISYGLDDRGSIPGRGSGIFFIFATASRPDVGPTQPHIQGVPGVKRPVREADHLHPPCVEVKNAWIYPPLLPIRLHVVVLS
jgi:hypothetical protein